MKKKILIAVLLSFGISTGAWATTITFDSFFKFNGGGMSEPVFEAIFDDGDTAGSVTLTMNYLSSNDANKLMEWYFNIDPALTIACGDISYDSGQAGACSQSGLQADGDGIFDFKFEFPSSGDQFAAGESSVWNISLGGLLATDFAFVSADMGGSGPYYSAVKQSAWWAPEGFLCSGACDGGGDNGGGDNGGGDNGGGDNGGTPIPEPGSLLLFGIGLLALGRSRRIRKLISE